MLNPTFNMPPSKVLRFSTGPDIAADKLMYCFIIDYLYRNYTGEVKSELIQVKKMISISPNSKFNLSNVDVGFNPETGFYEIRDGVVLFTIIIAGEEFEMISQIIGEWIKDPFITMSFIISMNKLIDGNVSTTEALVILKNEVIRNSCLKGKILTYRNPNPESFVLDGIKVVEPSAASLENIFIPQNKKDQFERFIFSIKNYVEHKINLRYLLNGVPGTGKTQMINSVINAVQGYATVIITKGDNFIANELFDFCSHFEPCLLVVDDIDLFLSDREEVWSNLGLSNFLAAMDGLMRNNIFLLASTNDKTLVDNAAIRPGRFDLIIDMDEINPENYLDIIRRETADEEIISLFNERLLHALKEKKVTGAFIVNLIKQLKSTKLMNGSVTEEDLGSFVSFIHKGFYSSNSEHGLKVVGF